MSPRPRPDHQAFLGELYAALSPWVRARGLGRLYPDTDVRLSGGWMPAPDLSFVKAEHLNRVQASRIVGPVDLAVEVVSPGNEDCDRETKFQAYAANGISWYWIVDLGRRVLEEYELVGASYGNRVEAGFDQPFSPRLFPGLTIDLA